MARTIIDIARIAFRTMSFREQRAYETLTAQGFKVIKRGWPDLLAVRGDEVRAIEVKDNSGQLKPQQAAIAEILSSLGVETEVWPNGMEERKRSWRPDHGRFKALWYRRESNVD